MHLYSMQSHYLVHCIIAQMFYFQKYSLNKQVKEYLFSFVSFRLWLFQHKGLYKCSVQIIEQHTLNFRTYSSILQYRVYKFGKMDRYIILEVHLYIAYEFMQDSFSFIHALKVYSLVSQLTHGPAGHMLHEHASKPKTPELKSSW